MKILLTGGTGFIARHLSKALIDQGHLVMACSRKKTSLTNSNKNKQSCKIDFMQMHEPEDWLPYLNEIDVVINTVGIIAETKDQSFEQLHTLAPISLFKACKQVGVKLVIQISALGADDTATVPYHLSKKSADDALKKMDLDWFILRPSLVVGEGGASSLFFRRLSNLPLIPIMGDGDQLIQPINIEELISTVVHCLDDDVESKQTLDLVGKESISYKDWLISLRTRRSAARFLPVPVSIMMPLSKLGRFINLPFVNPDSLIMLQQNNIADRLGLDLFLDKKPKLIKQQKLVKPTIEEVYQ